MGYNKHVQRLRSNALSVTVGDSILRATRVLKRKVQREGKFAELKKRRAFIPPSQARRLKMMEARRKIRRSQKENLKKLA